VKKKISGKADDIFMQTVHIMPKSKIESRVHYAAESARGSATSDRCDQITESCVVAQYWGDTIKML